MDLSLIRQFGLENNCVGIYDIDMRVADVLDAEKNKLVQDALQREAEKAIKDGAQAIVLACTGLMFVAHDIQEKLATEVPKIFAQVQQSKSTNKTECTKHRESMNEAENIYVPVLDPNQVAIGFLQMLVRCNLRHSQVCYRRPLSSLANSKESNGPSKPANAVLGAT